MSPRLELTLENRVDAIPEAAAAIRRFCEPFDIPREAMGQVTLALDEMLTNVVSYAWPEGGRHTIRLRLRVEPGRLVAEVTDDGVPFDPHSVPEPDLSASVEERRIGGLGVHFVMTLMDRVEYQRVGDENRLTLIKLIQPHGVST